MKRFQMKKGIAIKTLVAITIPVLIIFIIAQFLILFTVKKPVENLTNKQIQSESDSAAYQVNEYFSRYTGIVTQMAANTIFTQMYEQTPADGAMSKADNFSDIMETLKNIGASDEYIDTAWLGDVDASQLIQSDGAIRETGWDITQRPFYQQIMSTKDIILTEPYQDSKTQQWIVSVIQPIYKQGASAPIGIDCVDIEITELDTIMSQYSLGENGYFILSTGSGQIMNAPNKEDINKNVSQTGLSENVVSNITNKVSGMIHYTDNGKNYIGHISTIGNTGWTILAGMPESEF